VGSRRRAGCPPRSGGSAKNRLATLFARWPNGPPISFYDSPADDRGETEIFFILRDAKKTAEQVDFLLRPVGNDHRHRGLRQSTWNGLQADTVRKAPIAFIARKPIDSW